MSNSTKTGENKSADDTFEFIPNAVDQVESLNDSEGSKSSDWTDGGIKMPKKEVPASTNVEVIDTQALRRKIHDAIDDDDFLQHGDIQNWINGLGVVYPNFYAPNDDDKAMSAGMILGTAKTEEKKESTPADSSSKGRSPEEVNAIEERARKRLAGVLKFLEPEMKNNNKKN
ncbi:hypothetical protein ACHAPA_004377 [Fusarium lateritium]